MGTGANWLWAVIPRGPYPANWAAYYTTPDTNLQSNSPHSECTTKPGIAMFNPAAASKYSAEHASSKSRKFFSISKSKK